MYIVETLTETKRPVGYEFSCFITDDGHELGEKVLVMNFKKEVYGVAKIIKVEHPTGYRLEIIQVW